MRRWYPQSWTNKWVANPSSNWINQHLSAHFTISKKKMHLSDDCWKPHHVHILACGVDYCSSCCCSIITSVTHTVFLWEFPKWRTSVGMETKWWQLPISGMLLFAVRRSYGFFCLPLPLGLPCFPFCPPFLHLSSQPSSSTSVFISPSSQSVCWSLLRIRAAHLPSLTPITLSLLFVLALDRWPVNLTPAVLGCGGVLHTHDCYFLYLSWGGGGVSQHNNYKSGINQTVFPIIHLM